MKKNHTLLGIFALFLALSNSIQAQNDPTVWGNQLKIDNLRAYLTVLTSDSLEGRETGTIGNYRAANYIANHFKNIGIPKSVGDSSYFQKMQYTSESWEEIGLTIKGEDYRHLFDFYSFPATNLTQEAITTKEVLFLGYGIDDEKYSDYKGVKTEGKVVVILMGEPMQKGKSLLTGTEKASDWTNNIKLKYAAAKKYGVKTLLIVDTELSASIQRNRSMFGKTTMGEVEDITGKYANNLYISPYMFKLLIDEDNKKQLKAYTKARAAIEKGTAKSVVLKTDVQIKQQKYFSQLAGYNVLGFIEGSDPKLKEEIVVVSSHYDHLGKRGDFIYRGADDDGSGTSSVMEIARVLAEAKKQGKGPRRSILCMTVTGEEKGLLGSKFYTTYPIYPLKQTVADVNIDMVGRIDPDHEEKPNYIYVIGADKLSSDLNKINEEANAKYTKMDLDYKYNDPNDPNRFYYRSDHYNFAEKGIPIVFYFNGTHDDYHQPSDTIEKINFEQMLKRVQLAFYTAWEIANRDERLKVDSNKK